MKPGDYTRLAKDYIHRTGYSLRVLEAIVRYINGYRAGFTVAEVGAGTGKLTENLVELGLSGYAIEPNDAMRAEGVRLCRPHPQFQWRQGCAEETGLPAASVDWVIMGSSFHWTEARRSLPEFHRILRPGGWFTALWNPRDLATNALHQRIERAIHALLPDLKRVSSGASPYTAGIEDTLVSTGHFQDVLFMEAPHQVAMDRERYLGAWRSVNDIQVQAGEKFEQVLAAIAREIAGMETLVVPYRTRAWTVRRVT